MVAHKQTRDYNGDKLKPAIYGVLSYSHPMTRCQISLALGSKVGSVRLWSALKELIEDGQIIKVIGHPDIFYKTPPEGYETTARGRMRVKKVERTNSEAVE